MSQLDKIIAPADGVSLNWKNPAPDTIVAYYLDRGEKLNHIKRYANAEAYLHNTISDMGVSCAYLFKNGKWLFRPASKCEWFELNVKVANAQ